MIDFKTASIATRTSWQAGRQTTRAEDLAYSMFGIFDVGLDLRYGERDKAFERLQEQIINSYPLDESVLAWTSKELGDDKQPGILAPGPDCLHSRNVHLLPLLCCTVLVFFAALHRTVSASVSFILLPSRSTPHYSMDT